MLDHECDLDASCEILRLELIVLLENWLALVAIGSKYCYECAFDSPMGL